MTEMTELAKDINNTVTEILNMYINVKTSMNIIKRERKDIKITKIKHLEMKNMSEMKISLDWINRKLDITKQNIGKLKDKATETTEN